MIQASLEMAGRADYNGFNLLVADPNQAFLLSGGAGSMRCLAIEPGIHILSNEHDLNEINAPREDPWPEAPPSEQALLDRMTALLKSHEPLTPDDFTPCKHKENRGTRSSTIIFLREKKIGYFFTEGPPCTHAFKEFTEE